MKRVVLVLVADVAGSLLVVSASSGAGAAGGPPVVPGSAYLALGDSVTFGYMESNVVPPPNYRDAAAFPGYPEQAGAALHLTVANAACPGETSSSLINTSAQSNGCENAPNMPKSANYRPQFPLHVKYSGSQLSYAVSYLKAHHNVRLVSLMIGANDYFVCTHITQDGCASKSEQQAVLSKLKANVKVILKAVRKLYHGQIVIVNYYSLNYASPQISAMSVALNQAQDTAARPFGVEIADGYGEFKVAAFRFGGNTCGAGLLTQLGMPGSCGVHPSYAGQALLSEALEKAIRP